MLCQDLAADMEADAVAALAAPVEDPAAVGEALEDLTAPVASADLVDLGTDHLRHRITWAVGECSTTGPVIITVAAAWAVCCL